MKTIPELSVIVPAYNEADIIGATLDKLIAYLHGHAELGPAEIIVVATGKDDTAAIARSYQTKFPALAVLSPKKLGGKGFDVQIGFRAARGEYQLFTDADLSTPVEHIAKMVELLKSGNDVVIGKRRLRTIHKSKLRAGVSVLSNWLVRFMLLPGIHDSQCGFKGFTASAAKALFGDRLATLGWAFDMEVLAEARRKHFVIREQAIDDWHETRDDGLRNEGLGGAALRTLDELLAIRVRLWAASLAAKIVPIICLAGLSSFGLALWLGNGQSVWFDEGYSIDLIGFPVHRLIQLTSVDVHPPLYYLCLKAWAALFGTSDIALRSLSAVFGGLSVIIGLLLVRKVWGNRLTLLSIPFAVVAPFFLRYSFEIRMYALAGLICIAGTYVLVSAFQATTQRSRMWLWVAYGLLVAAGMYTLYYTALIWAAHFLWCIYMALQQRPRRRLLKLWKLPWLSAYVFAVALFLPWLPVLHKQTNDVQKWFWIGPATYHTVVSIFTFSLLYRDEWQVLTPWRSLVFMFALFACVYFVLKAFRLANRKQKDGLVLLALYGLVPIGLLYAISLPPFQPVFIERYESHAVLALYLLLGISVAMVAGRRRAFGAKVLGTALFVVLVAGVARLHAVGNYNFQQRSLPQNRQLGDYVRAGATTSTPIIAAGAYAYVELHHYFTHNNLLFYSSYNVGTTGGYAMLHNSPLRVTAANTFNSRNVWLIYGGSQPPYVPLGHYVDSHTVRKFGNYTASLYHYRAPSASSEPVLKLSHAHGALR